MMINNLIHERIQAFRFLWMGAVLLLPLILWFIFAKQHFFVPAFVAPLQADVTQIIEDVTLRQVFYGKLQDFPHGYSFTLETPQVVSLQIFEPWGAVEQKTTGGILVKEAARGVTEVARLQPKDAVWTRFFDVQTGDAYARGATLERELEPGTYYFEISAADNRSAYMLRVGTNDAAENLSYVGRLEHVYAVKQFLSVSSFLVLLSPYYYVPLLFSILLASVVIIRRRYFHA